MCVCVYVHVCLVCDGHDGEKDNVFVMVKQRDDT